MTASHSVLFVGYFIVQLLAFILTIIGTLAFWMSLNDEYNRDSYAYDNRGNKIVKKKPEYLKHGQITYLLLLLYVLFPGALLAWLFLVGIIRLFQAAGKFVVWLNQPIRFTNGK